MEAATAGIAATADRRTAVRQAEDRMVVDAGIQRRHRMARVPLAVPMAARDRMVVPAARMEEGVLTEAIANVVISGMPNAARAWAAFLFAAVVDSSHDAGTFLRTSYGVFCVYCKLQP